MSKLSALPSTVALLLALVGTHPRAEDRPQFIPTHDVDIIYDVIRPDRQTVRERVRWLASDQLERIDEPDRSTMIVDQKANQATLLNYASHTYSEVAGALLWPMRAPAPASPSRQGESVVAGLHCAQWSWTDDVEVRAACLTPDGVLLRFIIDGKTFAKARSVSYGAQDPELFRIPLGYAPAMMAPEARKLIR